MLLFACVHWLLLNEPGQALARHYPNLTSSDQPSPRSRAPTRIRRFASSAPRTSSGSPNCSARDRHRRTRSVGAPSSCPSSASSPTRSVRWRSSTSGAAADSRSCSIATSAGTSPGGAVGGPSPVVLTCGTRGDVPVPERYPPVAARIGLDRSPIDVTDPDAARWLEACVWPDQPDRFHRLQAAIGLAQVDPPTVRAGDAVEDLAGDDRSGRRRGPPGRVELVGPELPVRTRSDTRTSPSSTGSVRPPICHGSTPRCRRW